jgi:hypothetical protein
MAALFLKPQWRARMTQPPSTKDFDKGLATRKQVMGEDFVANAFGNATEFTSPFRNSSRATRGAMCGSAQGWT